MLMALLLYGHELRQARRATRRQLEEQTKAQERAARSSSCGLLGTGSDSGADSGASSCRLPTELHAKLETRRRHRRENSLLAMLNRPQVWTLNMSTSYPYTTTMAVLATAMLITLVYTYQGVDAQHLGVAATLPLGHTQGAADL